MLTKQVLDQNYKKCYKLCDKKIKVCATSATNIGSESAYRWDYANCSHGLSVMSAPPMPPSPNGSTSSIVSSEDSTSNLYGFPSLRPTQPFALLSQPSTSTSSSLVSSANKQLKLCRVCGDRAKSYHFGGISCDSCKAFFRRSVQNDAYRNFHCPYERLCEITINSRKSCQFCRFNKCISIGMEKSWVMTEEERMQMLKNRIEKRKQEEDEEVVGKVQIKANICEEMDSKYEPNISRINEFLTESEVKLIEDLVNSHMKCSKQISFNTNGYELTRSRTDILNILFTSIQQFALFAQRFESFTCISTQDKQILLRDGVLELCFLRGAFNYDMKGKYWRFEDNSSGFIYSDNLQIMVTKDLLEKHLQFIKTVKRLALDDPSYILLILIVLLSPDREGLSDNQLVQSEQEKYLILLKNYMNWRYGTQSSLLYPKLLLKLTDLRELSEAHTDYHLLLGPQELEQIQHKLSTLNLNIGLTVRAENMKIDSTVCCDSKLINNSVISPTDWTIRKCITNQYLVNKSLFADEELSTSSEGSEKLSSD